MKGFVKVDRQDLLSAIIGFEMRMDAGKELKNEAIQRYYDQEYPKCGWFTRWCNRKSTPQQFARNQLSPFCQWSDLLYVVLNEEETNLLEWWCWTHSDKVNPVKALYKANYNDYALVDQDMAAFITKHKDYMEGLK